jgi:hypothetical protein
MANSKISALTSATTPLAGTEVLPIVQSSATVKVAVNDMLSVTSWTSPAVDSNGNMFLRATDAFATGVGTQIGLGGKYNTTSYYPFGAVSGRKENATGNNVAGYLDLLTTTSGGSLTARMRLNSTGDATLLNGNFVVGTSGKGIDFSATPSTGTSELFADYEEGTYTATITPGTSGTITLNGSLDLLKYTKIGRVITVTGRCSVSSVSSPVGGTIALSLPFAISTSTESESRIGGAISSYNNVTTVNYAIIGDSGASSIDIYVNAASIAAGMSFSVSFSYCA